MLVLDFLTQYSYGIKVELSIANSICMKSYYKLFIYVIVYKNIEKMLDYDMIYFRMHLYDWLTSDESRFTMTYNSCSSLYVFRSYTRKEDM